MTIRFEEKSMHFRILVSMLLFAIAAPALAQLQVKDPWVRGTVPQQKTSGAFMQLSSSSDVRLVAARTPVAGVVELHEMKMENEVMKMGAVSGIDVPARQTVELAPSGYHIMLMDLKRQLKEGDTVPITLVFEGKDKKRHTVHVKAPVRPLAATGGHDGMNMH
jgi:copper(I)-binding protein